MKLTISKSKNAEQLYICKTIRVNQSSQRLPIHIAYRLCI